ncbi:hypothetical protein [Burkholderia anthina]|uniref:hypothetical protein n=1 Tax=Burkholderia anthina TaxID=179879 RepID=UPI0037BEE36B
MQRFDIYRPSRPYCPILDEIHQGLLRRAHGVARHAGEDDARSRKVDLRKARQRSVAILKHSGLDRTTGFAY